MAYNKKKRFLFIAVIIVLLLAVFFGRVFGRRLFFKNAPTSQVVINGQTIQAETVTSASDMYRGLSLRPSLGANSGMLFLFPDEAPREFVMRQMEFPLDIIFMDHHSIIKIAANLPPEGLNPTVIYSSDASADAVLEVNAGYAAAHNIKIGDYAQY